MISLTITSSLSLSSPFLPPSRFPNLALTHYYAPKSLFQKSKEKTKRVKEFQRRGICRAELQQDAPFAIAIGASMLNSLLFSSASSDALSEDDEDVAMSSTDARFSIMTIIGFIPYFNWLSWVFAAMDTGKRRYAVYALVYLAPYLRTNLSLSPEESWLPIASIVFCVVHIQLEASIYSGDLIGFNLFSEASKRFGLDKKHSYDEHLEEMDNEERTQGNMKLPLGKQIENDIRKWGVPRKPSQDIRHVDKDDEKQQ